MVGFYLCNKTTSYICNVIQLTTFLFISGTEIAFVLFIAVMVFGSDKLPDIARGLGKGLRTLKDATNDIKNEITKTADKNGIDTSFVKDLKKELDEVKDEVEEIKGSVKRKL